jgi:hypothetical protein
MLYTRLGRRSRKSQKIAATKPPSRQSPHPGPGLAANGAGPAHPRRTARPQRLSAGEWRPPPPAPIAAARPGHPRYGMAAATCCFVSVRDMHCRRVAPSRVNRLTQPTGRSPQGRPGRARRPSRSLPRTTRPIDHIDLDRRPDFSYTTCVLADVLSGFGRTLRRRSQREGASVTGGDRAGKVTAAGGVWHWLERSGTSVHALWSGAQLSTVARMLPGQRVGPARPCSNRLVRASRICGSE